MSMFVAQQKREELTFFFCHRLLNEIVWLVRSLASRRSNIKRLLLANDKKKIQFILIQKQVNLICHCDAKH